MSLAWVRIFLLSIFLCITSVALYSQETVVEAYTLSSTPGVYRQDIDLRISAQPSWEVEFQFAGSKEPNRWIEPRQSLFLSANAGETRTYKIRIRSKPANGESAISEIDYRIDKTAPASPETSVAPGTWLSPQKVELSLPVFDTDAEIITQVLITAENQEREVRGKSIELVGEPGRLTEYRLTTMAVDAAGNRSSPQVWQYKIDRRRERQTKEIIVYSPVPGDFKNQQYLYLDDQYFQEVRYTINGANPETTGILYQGPELLSATGNVSVRIWAKPFVGDPFVTTVSYRAGNETLSGFQSMVVTAPHVIQPGLESLFYVAGERPVTTFDAKLDHPLRVSPQVGTLRGLALRLKQANDESEFRYYFVLDGRIPGNPNPWLQTFETLEGRFVTFRDNQQGHFRLRLTPNDQPGQTTYITWDGIAPQDSKDPIPLKGAMEFDLGAMDAGTEELQLTDRILTMQTRQGEGAWGPLSRVPLDRDARDTLPEPEIHPFGPGTLQLNASSTEGLGYKVLSPFHSSETLFRLPEGWSLQVPFGSDVEVTVEFYRIQSGELALTKRTQTYSLSLLPPDPPLFIVEGQTVTISGQQGNTLWYRIRSIDEGVTPPVGDFRLYSSPVVLEKIDGRNIVYTVEAYARSDAGFISELSLSESIAVLTRPPAAAQVVLKEGRMYLNNIETDVSLSAPEPGVTYYYRVSDTETNLEPDPGTDPGAGAVMTIRLPASVETFENEQAFWLAILPVSTVNPDLRGPVTKIPLIYDPVVPDLPTITGVQEGKSYPTAVTIVVEHDAEETVLYRLVDSREFVPIVDPEVMNSHYQTYSIPIVADTTAGSETDFVFDYFILDRAGNIRRPENVTSFRVDKSLPIKPEFVFHDEKGMALQPQPGQLLQSAQTVVVEILSSEDAQIMVGNGPEGRSSEFPYAGKLKLDGGESGEEEYELYARAIDRAGNQSELTSTYKIRVDKLPPDGPTPPRIVRNGNQGVMLWPVLEEAFIEYVFVEMPTDSTPEDQSNAFLRATESVAWTIPDNARGITVFYRAVDSVGNIGDILSLEIPRRNQAPQPMLTGVEHKGLYSDEVRAIPLLSEGQAIVRYQLSTQTESEPEIDDSFPELPNDGLPISPITGESLDYRLTLRQFIPGYDPSEPITVEFTIDRAPPLPPQAQEPNEIVYLSEGEVFTLSAQPSDSIFLSFVTRQIPIGSEQVPFTESDLLARAETGGYNRYEQPLNLEPVEDAVMHYAIVAYTVDPAGNRSSRVRTWQRFVDTHTIYLVSPVQNPSVGRTENGSRSAPFSDLSRALQIAANQGKRSVVMAIGTYPVRDSLEFSTEVTISGNFDPGSWRKTDTGQTIIYPTNQIGSALMSVLPKARLIMRNVYVIDGGQQIRTLISVDGGKLDVSDSSIAITTASNAIESSLGIVSLESSIISCNDPEFVRLIDIDGGQLTINRSVVESSDLPPVLLKKAQVAEYTLIHSHDAHIRISQSKVIPRNGQNTTGIRLDGGKIEAVDTDFFAGNGEQLSVAFSIENTGDLTLSRSTVQSDRRSRNSVLFRINKGRAEISDSQISVSAMTGAYAFLLLDGEAIVTNARVEFVSASDFMTFISAENSHVEVQGSSVLSGRTKDFRLAFLRNSESSWNEFTLRLSTENAVNNTPLFSITGVGMHTLEENQLTGDNRSVLIYLADPLPAIVLRANVLEQWRLLLQEAPTTPLRQSEIGRGITSIEELERLQRQGSVFEGNRIRQGL